MLGRRASLRPSRVEVKAVGCAEIEDLLSLISTPIFNVSFTSAGYVVVFPTLIAIQAGRYGGPPFGPNERNLGFHVIVPLQEVFVHGFFWSALGNI
jgi:hypothetical protein